MTMPVPRVVGLDFETFYDKKAGYDIKSLGAWKYCDDPRFDPYMISVSDGQETWAGQPKEFNWESLRGAILVSHNKAFDAMVYESMVRKGMAPRIDFSAWHCTANLSSYLCNRRSLKDAASFLLGVTLSKDTRAYADGKRWADMVTDGKAEEMLAYARSDALHCWQLWAKYGHLWPETERQLSEMTIAQGTRGIQINVPLLETYIVIATQMLDATEQILPWVVAGKKPTSAKAIAEECRRVGIPGPPVKSHDGGEEAFVEWEKNYGAAHPWIANVSNYRSLNKFLGSLQTIHERLMPGGIFSFGLKYFGAHTGRWSGDAGLNMQNLKKVPLYRDENGLLISDEKRLTEIEYRESEARKLGALSKWPLVKVLEEIKRTLPPFVTASLDIRSLFIPRPGKKMIISDLAQIEARVLRWLAGDTDMLAEIAAGKSVYQAHAEKTMGWTGGDLKKENKDYYALAKARELGLGFGCGWEKFITVAQMMASLDITKDDPEFVPALNEAGQPMLDGDGKPVLLSGYGFNSKRIVKEYREQNPKVTATWKKLDEGFKASVGSHFEIELPTGRKLRYLGVRRECRTVKNAETGKLERKWMTTAMIGDRRYPLYGGLLAENATQATAREIFAFHLRSLQKTSGIDVLFSSHDEAINEVDNDVTPRDVEELMSVTPDFVPGLPVGAEAVEAPHYLK